MYAFVSNEYRGIVNTQRKLDFLMSIYSYPKFKKIQFPEEATKFFAQCDRDYIHGDIKHYGRRDEVGYVRIEYFIDGKNLFYNVYTDKFGFIKLSQVPANVKQDASYDLLKIKICNVNLDDTLIAHHCIAIQNILRLLDPYMNVELVLPDISIYLACTKYTGKNFAIQNTISMIKNRYGNTYFTVRKD